MDYKFTGHKYMTIGIREKIPEVVFIYLLKLMEKRKSSDIPMDYLQVFEIEGNGTILEITHRQEQPEYTEKYKLKFDQDIKEKVFVIDDIEHITFLLAEEY